MLIKQIYPGRLIIEKTYDDYCTTTKYARRSDKMKDITNNLRLWFDGQLEVKFECRKCLNIVSLEFGEEKKCICGINYQFLPKVLTS